MKILRIIIYSLTVAGMVLFLFFRKEDLRHLTQIHYSRAALLFLAGLLSISLNALLFKKTTLMFNLELPFREWFGLAVANTMYNYLLPWRGGTALKALYLKKNHSLPYTRCISMSGGLYVLNLFVAALAATVLGSILFLTGSLENNIFFYISIVLLISITGMSVFLYVFNPEKIPGKHRALLFIKNTAAGLKEFKHNPAEVQNLILLKVLFVLTIGLRLFIAYHILGIPVSYTKLVFIGSLVSFSMVFSLTPGNIGIKEGIIGVSSGLLGITPEQAVLGAVLDRLANVITIFGLGLVFSRLLLKNVDSKRRE